MIGKLNILLQFNIYQLNQDDTGAIDKTIFNNYVDWCQLEQTNGSRRLESAQISFSKSFKITKRHYSARVIDPEVTELVYNTEVLSIADIKLITEGRTTYEEILCYSAPK
jgi:hypothetical protein